MAERIQEDLVLATAIYWILQKYDRAKEKHPDTFHSPHEGAAIIQEEYEELWDLVKTDRSMAEQETEVLHIAVTALRYLTEVCWKYRPGEVKESAGPAGANQKVD